MLSDAELLDLVRRVVLFDYRQAAAVGQAYADGKRGEALWALRAAVLRSVRDPTDAMAKAGEIMGDYGGAGYVSAGMAEEVWRLMVDELLKGVG